MTTPRLGYGYVAHPTDGDELTGGRWVPVRGIQRWQPDPITIEPVACEDCGARLSEPCRAPTGKARVPHLGRIMRCVCGANRKSRRTYCDDCHVEASRANWRGAMTKRRAS